MGCSTGRSAGLTLQYFINVGCGAPVHIRIISAVRYQTTGSNLLGSAEHRRQLCCNCQWGDFSGCSAKIGLGRMTTPLTFLPRIFLPAYSRIGKI